MFDGTGEQPRVVLDESSLELLTSDLTESARSLTVLADALETLMLPNAQDVYRSDLLYDQPCLGTDLMTVLFGTMLDRDLRLRLGRLLDRCRSWSHLGGTIAARVSVDGRAVSIGSSLTFAVDLVAHNNNVACLVIDLADLVGWHDVTADDRTQKVFFCAKPESLSAFWRGLFELENVGERDFFRLAERAFDGLVFSETLTFRRFTGTYAQLRDPVVKILTVLNDEFPLAFRRHHGLPYDIDAELRTAGFRISPESPGTRGSQHMALRVVRHNGETYLCEWHAKIEPDRNRVHFALPDPRLGDRILIGIFVDHLKT